MSAPARGRLVVVSNRMPVSIDHASGGSLRLVPGSGGLVTALAPVLESRGGVWIGWPGTAGTDERFTAALADTGASYELAPVLLSEEEHQGFYCGFSNEVIWPLFHDLQSLCNFDPAYWHAYRAVNRRFAAVVAASAVASDLVWVHDYHLMGVGSELRRARHPATAAFFLHIPFPAPDVFMKLPWRTEVLRSLLDYELVGFQTPRDRSNFTDCVRQLLPQVQVTGRGQAFVRFRVDGRESRAGRFPIGIDFNGFYRRAADPAVRDAAHALRELLPERQLILGVDRLDYTKGIPERLRAFGNALERYPDLREKVTLIQVVVPSREDIPRYQELRATVENLVGQINGRFTRPGGWVPIHYVFRSLSTIELLSYYRAAQIALVTPLKDGMNLVAKEYCACSPDEDCVLILSEFAGAAAELAGSALLVNPYDLEGVADAIHTAFLMPSAERRARMRRMRRRLRRHDVFWWVDGFIRADLAREANSARVGGEAAVPSASTRTR